MADFLSLYTLFAGSFADGIHFASLYQIIPCTVTTELYSLYDITEDVTNELFYLLITHLKNYMCGKWRNAYQYKDLWTQ
jgi:hypothetical protein